MRTTRRGLLVGGAAGAVVAVAGGAAVQQGVLPGRPQVQSLLGLNGEAGVAPDIEPGSVIEGSFASTFRGGVETGWALVRPPGDPDRVLPLVVALHGLGSDHARLIGPNFALPEFLAAAVADGVPPFAIVAVDGGRSYWHQRPSGEDAGAMVIDELLPRMERMGTDTDRIGFLGWSMGGYGALRLGGLLGAPRVRAVVAASPAMWDDPDDASSAGFDDAEEYDEFTVQARQDELAGIPVRVDCGTGDEFYRAVEHYVGEFPDDADVTSTFEPGAHDSAYWRRMLPTQLEFLGARVGSAG